MTRARTWLIATLVSLFASGCSNAGDNPPVGTVTVTVAASGTTTSAAEGITLPNPKVIDGTLLAKFARRIDELTRENAKCARQYQPNWFCGLERFNTWTLMKDMATVVPLRADVDRYQFVLEAHKQAGLFIDEGMRRGCTIDGSNQQKNVPDSIPEPAHCLGAYISFDVQYKQMIEKLILIDTQ